jgi:endonuclease/exonuclease/phosphatase family metal-dependent hydrolase
MRACYNQPHRGTRFYQNGKVKRFYVIHFHPSNFEHRIREARLLQTDVMSLPDKDPHIMLAGDFNGFSPADRAHYDSDLQLVPFFKMLDQRSPQARNLNQGRLDYGGLEAILDQGFVDLIARERTVQSPFVGTFPAPLVSDQNHGTDRRLDYLMVTPNLVPHIQSAAILRDAVTDTLSDHYPVTATVRLP